MSAIGVMAMPADFRYRDVFLKGKPQHDRYDLFRIKAVYSELKELWEAINRKYYLFYEHELEDEIPDALLSILSEHDTFAKSTVYSRREEVAVNNNIGKMELPLLTSIPHFPALKQSSICLSILMKTAFFSSLNGLMTAIMMKKQSINAR